MRIRIFPGNKQIPILQINSKYVLPCHVNAPVRYMNRFILTNIGFGYYPLSKDYQTKVAIPLDLYTYKQNQKSTYPPPIRLLKK